MLRYYTKTAELICGIRWDFVREVEPGLVLDYGSGCGFFKAFAPENTVVDTYDVMPVPITGINHESYDLITFWDVLEHIPDFSDIRYPFDKTNYVAITVPIKPRGMRWKKYKHYKPLEHIHHFTDDSLIDLMESFNYSLVKKGSPECPPREHIKSFLFKNNEKVNT